MVQAVASEQAQPTELQQADNQYVISNYVGDYREIADGPQGFLVELRTPHGVIDPHFHRVDQFQIVIAGGGRLGKHALEPIAIHYADAYTPYGPIVTEEAGITFFNLRSASDVGAYWMPGSRQQLKRRARRSIAVHATLHSGPTKEAVTALLPLHEDGLAVYVLHLASGQELIGPTPDGSGGQFYLVLDGSLIIGDQTLPPRSLVRIAPDDDAPHIGAGHDGLTALIAQFPRLNQP